MSTEEDPTPTSLKNEGERALADICLPTNDPSVPPPPMVPLVGDITASPSKGGAKRAAPTSAGSSRSSPAANNTKLPRRQCRFPGCSKTIKSQGHCQRHGARAKRCRVDGCEKQAQGTHDGMCKRHWKEVNVPRPPPKPEEAPPAPSGESVYDSIIPASIAWKATKKRIEDKDVMPLVAHLRDNGHLEAGWHRKAERAARGVRAVPTPAAQFESWERQLVMFEIMLISGTMWNSHRDLAHAWGREKGFHNVLVSQVCERRGELDRKKRSDTGRSFSAEQKASFREKLNKARSEKRAKTDDIAATIASPAVAAAAAAAAALAAAEGGPGMATTDMEGDDEEGDADGDVDADVDGDPDNDDDAGSSSLPPADGMVGDGVEESVAVAAAAASVRAVAGIAPLPPEPATIDDEMMAESGPVHEEDHIATV